MTKHNIFIDFSKLTFRERDEIMNLLPTKPKHTKSYTMLSYNFSQWLFSSKIAVEGKHEININQFKDLFPKSPEKTQVEISRDSFLELAKEHLIALESYQMNEYGETQLEIFGIGKLYDEIFIKNRTGN